jgi:hypothetical protein
MLRSITHYSYSIGLSKLGTNIHIIFVAFCFWLIIILLSGPAKKGLTQCVHI